VGVRTANKQARERNVQSRARGVEQETGNNRQNFATTTAVVGLPDAWSRVSNGCAKDLT
jgi:hypothetical protein